MSNPSIDEKIRIRTQRLADANADIRRLERELDAARRHAADCQSDLQKARDEHSDYSDHVLYDEESETVFVRTTSGRYESVFAGSSTLDFPHEIGATPEAIEILRSRTPLKAGKPVVA